MSPELLDRAIKKQRSLLHNNAYLKKISAWQYLKSTKRLSDFIAYKEAIVNAINSGNIGSPDDPDVPKHELNKAIKQAQQTGYTNTDNDTAADSDVWTVREREKFLYSEKNQSLKRTLNIEEPDVPHFEDYDTYYPSNYFIKYISAIDGSEVTVEIPDMESKEDTVFYALRHLWDIKKLINVYSENDAHSSSYSNSSDDMIINPDDYSSNRELSDDVVSVMTNNEFNSFPEAVADIHDDKTTEECPDGRIYEGVDLNGNSWHGPKSSYREVLDSDDYESPDDYEISIVDSVEDDKNDVIISGTFNRDAFKKALREGIVHFVYKKVVPKSAPSGTQPVERQAFGTTNPDLMEMLGLPNKPNTPNRYNTTKINYYDLNSHGWRSCKNENITIIYDESYDK